MGKKGATIAFSHLLQGQVQNGFLHTKVHRTSLTNIRLYDLRGPLPKIKLKRHRFELLTFDSFRRETQTDIHIANSTMKMVKNICLLLPPWIH